jgi:hypothetical protein
VGSPFLEADGVDNLALTILAKNFVEEVPKRGNLAWTVPVVE